MNRAAATAAANRARSLQVAGLVSAIAAAADLAQECECGDPMSAHHLTQTAKRRTWCTSMTGDRGQCPCRLYTPREDP